MTAEQLSSVAEITLSYSSKVKPSDRPTIRSSEDTHKLFLSVIPEGALEFREYFYVILLNRTNRVLGIVNISQGGTHGTVVDARHIFACALKANASYIILAHNHPSGNQNPSKADLDLTNKTAAAGRLLEISVIDHVIVTPDTYFSFADEGYILNL